MTINFDTSFIDQLLYLPPSVALWRIFFWYFGWFPVAFATLWGIKEVWLRHRVDLWEETQKFVLLAIDVPRNNAQSLRAVENLFVYLGGAHHSISLIEKWWEGKEQEWFSFEIVSIGGYIQFLIRTNASFKGLIENAIYSQYPDAEVYEVKDYVKVAPNHYPDEEYDIWGAEFIQTGHSMLPIRTYPEFEHQFGPPETHYHDPMASLMDLMSGLKKGEQLWYQIIVIPTDPHWTKKKDELVSKVLREKKPTSKANSFIDKTLDLMGEASEHVYELWGDIKTEKKKEPEMFKMMNLKPHEKLQVEGAERKVEKLGFEVKIRAIYLSRKEVMNKRKAVSGFVGYIKQFNTGGLNGFKPDTKKTQTSAKYFFVDSRTIWKKNKIMRAYKRRSDMRGRKPFILNVEELATLWHFPIDAVVKAPLMQRAAARRVEPPMALPFSSEAKKNYINREPIFDEGFEIKDEKAPEPIETEKVVRRNNKPAFMEEPQISDSIVENSSNSIPKEEPYRDQPVSPSDHRGTPPSNLPFAD